MGVSIIPKIQEHEKKILAITTKYKFLRLTCNVSLISVEEIYVNCT